MLTFDPKEHRYYWHGAEVISVTKALDGMVDYTYVTDVDRDWGSLVHRETINLDLGLKTLDDYKEPLRARMVAWQAFKEDFNMSFEPNEIEVRVYHRLYRYAGTADRVKPGLIVDIKSGALNHVCGYQLSGYTEAYKDEHRIGFMRRMGVQLKKDGTYDVKPYRDPRDFHLFLNQLSKARKENGRGLGRKENSRLEPKRKSISN